MRFIAPAVLIVAACGVLSTFALARGTKTADACVAPVAVAEPIVETCTASEKLCENWLKGRAAYRATFVKSVPTCG